MTPSVDSTADPTRCPLCGEPNDCQLCTTDAYKGPCWCTKVKIPEELLARVPAELRNRACICRKCVTQFHREQASHQPAARVLPRDFYFENGLIVFTSEYHLRRGYCCGNGCRHCPYTKSRDASNPET
jgi:hypothetical protein